MGSTRVVADSDSAKLKLIPGYPSTLNFIGRAVNIELSVMANAHLLVKTGTGTTRSPGSRGSAELGEGTTKKNLHCAKFKMWLLFG